MKFHIKNKDGEGLFYTEDSSCIPIDKLDSMNLAGLLFYLNGRRISYVNLKSQFDGTLQEADTSQNATADEVTSFEFPVTSRTILCVNTGKMYRTQKEAGEDLNLDPAMISYSISQDSEYKGYKFVKAMNK